MPRPTHCSNRFCRHATGGDGGWLIRYGHYSSAAHGVTQRYRCSGCGTTLSDQTESLHYYAKRHVPFHAIWLSLTSGSSQSAIASRYRLSLQAVHNAVIRLGRQAIAGQARLLQQMNAVHTVVMDGLRSFVTSQDYPCDLSMIIESDGETILSIEHAIMRRGGRMREYQRRRVRRKMQRWQPQRGHYRQGISLLLDELWNYLRPPCSTRPAVLCSDMLGVYAARVSEDPVCRHFGSLRLFEHRRISSRAPRTRENPLFPANYVDLLLRHRMKEHTRQTIAFARNAVSQMHRAWIFAWDHNVMKPHRVRRPGGGPHAAQAVTTQQSAERIRRQTFTRRIDLCGVTVPKTLRRVWMHRIATPPHRWRAGQTGTNVHLPAFARQDLMRSHQQAC